MCLACFTFYRCQVSGTAFFWYKLSSLRPSTCSFLCHFWHKPRGVFSAERLQTAKKSLRPEASSFILQFSISSVNTHYLCLFVCVSSVWTPCDFCFVKFSVTVSSACSLRRSQISKWRAGCSICTLAAIEINSVPTYFDNHSVNSTV